MDVTFDQIEFRRLLAAPFPGGRTLRDALDIEVNGVSLSRSLEGAPFDIHALERENAVGRWMRPGTDVPVLNCLCGDVGCGGYYVDITVDEESVTWTGLSDRPWVFQRAEFEGSLGMALR